MKIRNEQRDYVLKDVPEPIHDQFNQGIWTQLQHGSNKRLRLPIDTIPQRRIFVCEHLKSDFLNLLRQRPSLDARRRILRTSLEAIADLHERDIVHLDVKPDNILVDNEQCNEATTVERVMLSDLENAAHLPGERCIKGMLAGSDVWRSAEAHLRGELGKPTDMFSFGLVCIFAMCDKMVCEDDEDFQAFVSQGAEPLAIRLQRLVSYFGDKDGINGLLTHVGDDDTSCEILSLLWDERHADYISYKPFVEWSVTQQNEGFGDVITRIVNLDPKKRMTAKQALMHPWFKVEEEG
ncbi:calcium/calmodulin dependent protein kinase [Hortaea werneckii]|nr:calcium/calmodulin dependent protein kinase [Hortaea werneckii]KAI6992300.1 calcium/calmodulin dependent protein kinase [Hortaea werneckii]KAI7144815.1 calcium/calmodulin dependent protein kinase [Hortaea werneckii]KAI7172625.1 calcium/calmodulin dependent protein kinase [Hortaea werneckii]